MRPTDAGSIAERVYETLKPLQYEEEEHDYPLLKYLGAMGRGAQPVEDIARDGETPLWSKMLDANRAPLLALPWLGQFVGVSPIQRNTGESDEDYEVRLRAYVLSKPGFGRGRNAAIVSAVQQYLTGNKIVTIVERDTSAYHFEVRSLFSETPIGNVPLIEKAIEETKAAGLQFVYVRMPDWTYDDIDALYDTYDDIDGAYATYDDIDANNPGGGSAAPGSSFGTGTFESTTFGGP